MILQNYHLYVKHSMHYWFIYSNRGYRSTVFCWSRVVIFTSMYTREIARPVWNLSSTWRSVAKHGSILITLLVHNIYVPEIHTEMILIHEIKSILKYCILKEVFTHKNVSLANVVSRLLLIMILIYQFHSFIFLNSQNKIVFIML